MPVEPLSRPSSLLPLRSWSEALVQLKRDLTMVRRRLAGVRSSPVTYTMPAARLTPHSAPRELVVDRAVRETHDVVTLVLRDPDPEPRPFIFDAGQFFTLLVDIDGAIVPRNYSASSPPGALELHLTIKKKPGGQVSSALVDLSAGARLRVLGPFGTFTPRPSSSARRLVLLAGGVGITPLLSIMRTVLATEPTSVLALVYGNRSAQDIAFASTLDALAGAHPDRVDVRHVLEAPSDARVAEPGRLDRANVARILDAVPIASASDTEYLVCGPDAMQREVLAALAARGIDDQHIKRERFAIGGSSSMRPRDLETDARRVTIVSRDRLIRTTALAGATLLEAGLSASAPMPFSCAVGGCGACRVRLLEGEVDLDEPHCLSDEERAAGYVLACVGRPRGACTIEITHEEGGGR